MVIMKCSFLKVYRRAVGRTYLMSVNINSNSFEVHGEVGQEHESAATKELHHYFN